MRLGKHKLTVDLEDNVRYEAVVPAQPPSFQKIYVDTVLTETEKGRLLILLVDIAQDRIKREKDVQVLKR